jgi:hypothetical protein
MTMIECLCSVVTEPWTIDVMMNKNCRIGAISWYQCVAEDSRIPKMPVINPLRALFYPQTQKNNPGWIVNPQPQLLKSCLFGE